MDHPPVKAVVFDVYHTLLKVQDGPAETESSWRETWREFTGAEPAALRQHFDAACRAVVARDHAVRKAAGVAWPEVEWRSVVRRAAPALSGLDRDSLDAFLAAHARLQRRTMAMPGSVAFLAGLRQRGILTGIASNAQNYTLGEMERAGLGVAEFTEELCFWSFREGFSKPDPRVFAWLAARLGARGISPGEILMIGDRLDNDLAPALAAGWQGWHFTGTWPTL